MELGEKLRLARLEAGLSQRQLCGDVITRNMLSLIEHGAARPSMDTLKYLAAGLGKPVSYFLEEDGVLLPNLAVIEKARKSHDAGDFAQVLVLLADYQTPDPVFDREKAMLEALSLLGLAESAISDGRIPYAKELLRRIIPGSYCADDIAGKKQLLLAKIDPNQADLRNLDEELLLQARRCLAQGDLARAAALLDAMENREDAQWQLIRGDVFLRDKAYTAAKECFHLAEAAFPTETAKLLEVCYRELGDYKQAYFYACKQR